MSKFRPSRDRGSVEGREVKCAGVRSTPGPTVGGASSVTYPSRGSRDIIASGATFFGSHGERDLTVIVGNCQPEARRQTRPHTLLIVFTHWSAINKVGNGLERLRNSVTVSCVLPVSNYLDPNQQLIPVIKLGIYHPRKKERMTPGSISADKHY